MRGISQILSKKQRRDLKKYLERYQNFTEEEEEEKKKKENTFANDIGISPKIKKGLLSMEKDIPKCEKIKVC